VHPSSTRISDMQLNCSGLLKDELHCSSSSESGEEPNPFRYGSRMMT
jgi:hypothetical protein